MGMSASQARLLSLTARLSDLEFQAQSVSNAKIRLADKSTEASRKYQDALDKQKLTVKSKDDAGTYIDATANRLTTYGVASGAQRILTDSAGTLLVSQDVVDKYTKANGNLETFLNAFGYTQISTSYISETIETLSEPFKDENGEFSVKTNLTKEEALENINGIQDLLNQISDKYEGEELQKYISSINEYFDNVKSLGGIKDNFIPAIISAFLASLNSSRLTDLISSSTPVGATEDNPSGKYSTDTAATNYYTNIFNQMENGYKIISNENASDSEWLYNQLESGNIYISQLKQKSDGTQDFEQISWASGDNNLLTVDDERDLAKAEAEYELEMSKIQAKDKRFDLNLKQLDTEHNAVQTEMESVKKVIDKNIEKSFKIFEA